MRQLAKTDIQPQKCLKFVPGNSAQELPGTSETRLGMIFAESWVVNS